MDKTFYIDVIKKNMPYLSKEFGVEKIGIFGSIAKGVEKENSDIDLIVTFSIPLGFKFSELVDYLENILKRKVDLLTEEGINNIRLKNISRDIKKDIIYV